MQFLKAIFTDNRGNCSWRQDIDVDRDRDGDGLMLPTSHRHFRSALLNGALKASLIFPEFFLIESDDTTETLTTVLIPPR